MALGLVICGIMAAEVSWKRDMFKAMIGLTIPMLLIALSFLFWRNRPRFVGAGLRGIVYMCGLTLFVYNFQQYKAGLGFANGTWPAASIWFNLVVVLAYAALIAIHAWQGDLKNPVISG